MGPIEDPLVAVYVAMFTRMRRETQPTSDVLEEYVDMLFDALSLEQRRYANDYIEAHVFGIWVAVDGTRDA